MKTAFSPRLAAAMRRFRQDPEYRAAERENWRRFLERGSAHSTSSASMPLLPGKEELARAKAKKA